MQEGSYKIVFLIALGVILFVGISYAWLKFNMLGKQEINLETGDFDIDLVETNGNLELIKAIPVADQVGKQGKTFSFIYEIIVYR